MSTPELLICTVGFTLEQKNFQILFSGTAMFVSYPTASVCRTLWRPIGVYSPWNFFRTLNVILSKHATMKITKFLKGCIFCLLFVNISRYWQGLQQQYIHSQVIIACVHFVIHSLTTRQKLMQCQNQVSYIIPTDIVCIINFSFNLLVVKCCFIFDICG